MNTISNPLFKETYFYKKDDIKKKGYSIKNLYDIVIVDEAHHISKPEIYWNDDDSIGSDIDYESDIQDDDSDLDSNI